MFRTVFFDLDGTLTESGPGIMNAVRHALKKQGLPEPEETVLRRFIGPPLEESFQKYCGMDAEQAAASIPLYREYYLPVGAYENAPYPGIPEMLKKLSALGFRLCVATAKPETVSEEILRHFGLEPFFKACYGVTPARTSKRSVIACALTAEKITDRSEVLMVGDRENDIDGAKFNGLSSCGVLYGYGSRAELEAAGADYIAASVNDLEKLILTP